MDYFSDEPFHYNRTWSPLYHHEPADQRELDRRMQVMKHAAREFYSKGKEPNSKHTHDMTIGITLGEWAMYSCRVKLNT